MKPEEFVNEIKKTYDKASESAYPVKGRIIRGTQKSISVLSEDLFAKYVSELIPENMKFGLILKFLLLEKKYNW